MVVTASGSSGALLWDIASGQQVGLIGHQGGVPGVAFSPDGRYLATSGADGTARLWDISTGKEIRRFTGHTSLIRTVVFSPDGKTILTASEDNTARVWLTDLNDTIRAVCAMLTRDLTPEERIQFGITDERPTCPEQ
jgi:WD40 repeat protein